MAWSTETPSYCGWNELHVKNAEGKMEVHYYLERKDGCADLAVVGRVKNSRRMSFRYALKKNRSVLKKLNSVEDVADWLNSIVSGKFSYPYIDFLLLSVPFLSVFFIGRVSVFFFSRILDWKGIKFRSGIVCAPIGFYCLRFDF